MKTCENCGERVYRLGCVNCDEPAYIEEQDRLTDEQYPPAASTLPPAEGAPHE